MRNRYLLPTAVLLAVGLGSMLSFTAGASAQGGASSQAAPATAKLDAAALGVSPSARTLAAVACAKQAQQINIPGPVSNGSPKGLPKVCVNGRLVAYGNPKDIVYVAPPASYVNQGEVLFAQNCSTCHGTQAEGTAAAPTLSGVVGPAAVIFWVTTGRMPAATPLQVQAQVKPPRLTDLQATKIAAFINSLGPKGPYIPHVNVPGANLTDGASLFAANCAQCHTITGAGDELAYSTNAPSLHGATATQVAAAMRTGPGNMPRFTGNMTDAQVRDVVGYVTEKIQNPSNPGGVLRFAGLGGVGPVAEGFVALLFGVGGLMLVCFWIGDRAK